MDEFQIDRLDNDPVRQRLEGARTQAYDIFDVDRTVGDMATWFQKAILEYGGAATLGRHSVAELLTHPGPARGSLGETSAGVDDPVLDPRLAEAVAALLRDEPHEWSDVAAILYGRTVALVLVREFEDQEEVVEPRATDLWSLGGFDDLAYVELVASLAKAIRAHRRAHAACLRWLERRVARVNDCPGEGAHVREREAFDHFVQEWRQHPSLDRLWRDAAGANFLVSFDGLYMAAPILMADPAGALSRLDALRFPQPLERILWHRSIRYDHNLLAKLLRSAPSCVREKDEKEWNGSLLAVLLLNTIDEHCRSLWDLWQKGATDDSDSASTVLSSWIADLAGIVMDREDGGFLGTRWLLLKAMDERMERGRRRSGDFAQTSMIEWIGDGLAKAGLTGSGIAKYADFTSSTDRDNPGGTPPPSSDDDRSPRLSALAIMAMTDCMIGGDHTGASKFLKRLDKLLISRDQELEEEAVLDVGATGFPASCVGYLLAYEGNPAERWKQSWRLLAEQRRTVQHWRQTKDADSMAPSLFLIASGIAALDWLCSETDARRPAPGEFWRVLFDAVRECWLTVQVTHLSERIENDIQRLFARHSMVFDSPNVKEAPGQNSPYSEVLANDLSTLGGDDVLVAACCVRAYRNGDGTAASVLHQALQHDEERGYALLRQFEQWQEVERNARKNPGLTAAINEMRKAIDAGAVAGPRRGGSTSSRNG